MENVSASFHVLYVQLTSSLTEEFLHLQGVLKKIDITLIPIYPKDLGRFLSFGHQILLAPTSCLKSKEQFQYLRKQVLDMALMQKKATLVHLNSFGPPRGLERPMKKGHYFHISLPETTFHICQILLKLCQRKDGNLEPWPGGKRAKLPFTSLSDPSP